ncbi:ABC transporter permease [Thomasclavelia cocleata]|jgi:hypothetical protein|nr:ABC transporter permease [Thomasclavelia cocleata]
MNSRKSWVNKPLLRNVIKNNLFPAKISLIVFFGFFALALISADGTGIGQLCIGLFGISAVVLTTIYPCLIQSYLINKTKSSMMKTIPLQSRCVWFTNYLAGYLIVLITLLIEGIGIIFIDIARSYNLVFSGNILFRFILMIFMLLFIYYTITFLVSSMAGNRLGQIIFSIVVYTLPVVLLGSLFIFNNYLVPGTINQFETYYIYVVFPLAAGLEFISTGNLVVIIHCFITLVLLELSYYVYKNRDDEHIDEPLVFNKIGIVLKSGIVLIVTITIFYLILLFSYIDITFGIKGMLILLMVYLIIGIIIAIFVEMIFKSQYIYRKLLIYIPILLIFFGINYFIANSQYYKTLDEVIRKPSVAGELNISNFENDGSLSINIEHDQLLNLIEYLNKNRDKIHYQQIMNNNANVYFNLYNIDNRGNYNDTLLQYRFDKQLFIDYFKNQEKSYLNSDNFENESYLTGYYDGIEICLNSNETKQLYQMSKDQNIVAEDFFNGDMLELSGSSGKKYNLKGNERIYEFLKDEKIIGHTKFLEQCKKFIYDDTLLTDENSKIFEFIKEQLNIETFTLYNNEIELIEFDDIYATFSMNITAVGEIQN